MISLFQIDKIVDSPSKIGVLRVLSAGKGFKATGREIARLAGFSTPSTHESLKELHTRNILTLEIIGNQHVYALNEANRIVQRIIRPIFQVERGSRIEIAEFIKEHMQQKSILAKVTAVILYGSLQKGTAKEGSDIDIAVVVNKESDVKHIEEVFIESISKSFKDYFGIHLDPYIKSSVEFKEGLKKNRAPISTLLESYAVLYGKDPLEI